MLDDADLDLVASELALGRLMMNGQACSASKRVLVDPSLHDDLVERLQVVAAAQVVGPVFTVIPMGGDAEALRVANLSSFGLMASVFSRDLERALALAGRLQAGGVVINGSDNYRPPAIPFGGVKMSGVGREGVGHTLRELTREKTIVLRRMWRESEDSS